ncbi:16S rRNA (guanine(966)-N(2))-methyltransferase RsmD [Anaerobacillus sp. MEB173]|uniref:16S rRNA (guanine(966)-N(2))-methyltransferase RsmD n=1 Tax=Anaerobacillus sp. MEB173 TaxID=3383345 RepID=UPI003F93F7DB
MRVISGKCKGRPLKAVPGTTTRPTTDKVKESIFNIIGPYFQGGLGLDLYGGSGGLGIEGLSRGLEKVIFVDNNRKAIETIKENVKQCDFMDQAEIYRNEAGRALKALLKRELTFSVVFLDPPYAKQNIESEMAIISDFQLLDSVGFIVCEHDVNVTLRQTIGDLNRWRYEQYGDTAISIYRFESGINE